MNSQKRLTSAYNVFFRVNGSPKRDSQRNFEILVISRLCFAKTMGGFSRWAKKRKRELRATVKDPRKEVCR